MNFCFQHDESQEYQKNKKLLQETTGLLKEDKVSFYLVHDVDN